MNATKKDANYSLTTLAKVYSAVTVELSDVIRDAREAVEAVQQAKAIKKETSDAIADLEGKESGNDRGLWGYFLTIGRSVDEMTREAENDKLTAAVLEAVIGEVAEGEAAKSIASYASTVKKITAEVRAGRTNWNLISEKKYSEVREFLKSDDAKKVDAAKKKVSEAVTSIAKHKDKARAVAMLEEVASLLESYATEAANSREKEKPAAKAAAALEEIRQQHPTEPATLETVKAPHAAAVA